MARVRLAPPAVFVLLLSAACEDVYVMGTTIPAAQRLNGVEFVGFWKIPSEDGHVCIELRRDTASVLTLAGVTEEGDSAYWSAQVGRLADRLIVEISPQYEGWPMASLLLELEHHGDSLVYRGLDADLGRAESRRLGLAQFTVSPRRTEKSSADESDLVLAGPPDDLARIVEAMLLAEASPPDWATMTRVASCPAREG